MLLLKSKKNHDEPYPYLLGRICNLPTLSISICNAQYTKPRAKLNFTKGLYILRDFKKFTSKAVPNITVAIGSALKGGESLLLDCRVYVFLSKTTFCLYVQQSLLTTSLVYI